MKKVTEAGLYHNDINSCNILVTRDPQTNAPEKVYLIDFGSATQRKDFSRWSISTSTRTKTPEMLLKKECDGMKHTVWQLGVVLWEMVYGTLPFKSGKMIKKHKLTICKDTEVTLDFQSLVLSCLSFDPDNRPTLEQILSHKWLTSS